MRIRTDGQGEAEFTLKLKPNQFPVHAWQLPSSKSYFSSCSNVQCPTFEAFFYIFFCEYQLNVGVICGPFGVIAKAPIFPAGLIPIVPHSKLFSNFYCVWDKRSLRGNKKVFFLEEKLQILT